MVPWKGGDCGGARIFSQKLIAEPHDADEKYPEGRAEENAMRGSCTDNHIKSNFKGIGPSTRMRWHG